MTFGQAFQKSVALVGISAQYDAISRLVEEFAALQQDALVSALATAKKEGLLCNRGSRLGNCRHGLLLTRDVDFDPAIKVGCIKALGETNVQILHVHSQMDAEHMQNCLKRSSYCRYQHSLHPF